MDSFLSSIRVDFYGSDISRILPKINDLVNEEWLTNKARYCFDARIFNRIKSPMLKLDGEFYNISLKLSLNLILSKVLQNLDFADPIKDNIVFNFITGPFLDLDSALNLKRLQTMLDFIKGVRFNLIQDESVNFEHKSSKIINYSQAPINNYYNFSGDIVFVGCDPKLESPLLNIKFKKLANKSTTNFFSIGMALNNLPYKVKNLGNSVFSALEVLESRISISFTGSKLPLFVLGQSLILRNDYDSVITILLNYVEKVATMYDLRVNPRDFVIVVSPTVGYNSLNFVNLNPYSVNFKEFNFYQQKFSNKLESKPFEIFYFLSSNALESKFCKLFAKEGKPHNSLVVFQGSNAEDSTAFADIIIPTLNIFEKSENFINLNNNIVSTTKVISGYFEDHKKDSFILESLIEVLKAQLIY